MKIAALLPICAVSLFGISTAPAEAQTFRGMYFEYATLENIQGTQNSNTINTTVEYNMRAAGLTFLMAEGHDVTLFLTKSESTLDYSNLQSDWDERDRESDSGYGIGWMYTGHLTDVFHVDLGWVFPLNDHVKYLYRFGFGLQVPRTFLTEGTLKHLSVFVHLPSYGLISDGESSYLDFFDFGRSIGVGLGIWF